MKAQRGDPVQPGVLPGDRGCKPQGVVQKGRHRPEAGAMVKLFQYYTQSFV